LLVGGLANLPLRNGRRASRAASRWGLSAATVGALVAAAVGGAAGLTAGPPPAAPSIAKVPESLVPPALPPPPRVEPAAAAPPRREALPITAAQRKAGFGECYAPDPVGLGPYAPYRKIAGARVAIPQRGGHTEDLGFDVVVHFHGGDPARKTFVQVVGGVVFAAVDKGVGSGPYQQAFVQRDAWTRLRAGIENTLRAHTGDERAHIRHLAITSWSAGYGAINQILATNGPEDIDAVVLLDGPHAGRNPRWPGPDDGSLRAIDRGTVSAVFDFAAAASRGEKIFVLTHSNVVPTGYASVHRTADLLLDELGLERQPQVRELGLAHQLTATDERGLHVWGFSGHYEEAHCAQVSLLGEIVRDLLEPAWETPPLDRSVPNTPAPVLGTAPRAQERAPRAASDSAPSLVETKPAPTRRATRRDTRRAPPTAPSRAGSRSVVRPGRAR
jgi:hypothetical protein